MSDLLDSITQALGLPASAQQGLHLHAAGALPSTFAVTELASASIAAAGLAMARLLGGQTGL
ncbi:acyl-CoA transferase, partial [Pseudomonas sp. MAFF212428]|nr:acyl-CoA transferase [Pseudomonas brassicae]